MNKRRALRSAAIAGILIAGLSPVIRPSTQLGTPSHDSALVPAAGEPEGHENEGKALTGSEEWFYGQRSFPRQHIPDRAYEHARAQASHQAPAADPSSFSTGSSASLAASVSSNPAWSALGPHPISSINYSSPYVGAMPVSGRVTTIATSPTNADVAYLGAAAGGVWKTTDSGVNWTPVFDSQAGLAIGSIAVSPTSDSTVYVGTGEANLSQDSYFGVGLYKSVDGGTSWTKLGGATFDGCHIGDIIVKPNTASTIVVAAHAFGRYGTACPGGLYRSTDGGATWTQVLPTTAAFDLSVSAAAPTVMFAGVYGTGILKSTDSGATWTQLGGGTSGLPNTGIYRAAVAVSPTDGTRIYAVLANNTTLDTSAPGGIYVSSDSGSSWTRAPSYDSHLCGFAFGSGQCWYDLAAAVDPKNPDIVYVGGSELAKYTFSSGTWSYSIIGFDSAATHATGIHVDMHALSFDASTTPRLWIGSDGGAYRTADGGSSFTNLNGDLEITEFYPGISGSAQSVLFGGAQDNATNKYTGSPGWSNLLGGDGGYTAIDPTNANVVYASSQYLNMAKSTNGGGTWTYSVGPSYGSDRLLFIAPFEMSPSDPLTLYAGTTRLWRTTTGAAGGAASWTSIGPSNANVPNSDEISAIGLTAADASTIYIGRYGGVVQVTHDGGTTWSSITAGLPTRYVT
ncbi:MAG: hypothetical protein M3290_12765, partial [Actinomycetota bacterium]|nr:hypothetical protein [Actinomycetota bacterium]